MFSYILIFALLAFASRIGWLVYCGWVANAHPTQGAAIIAASGQHFPFKRIAWRWPRSKGQ